MHFFLVVVSVKSWDCGFFTVMRMHFVWIVLVLVWITLNIIRVCKQQTLFENTEFKFRKKWSPIWSVKNGVYQKRYGSLQYLYMIDLESEMCKLVLKLDFTVHGIMDPFQRRYDMNRWSQMQGGRNWVDPFSPIKGINGFPDFQPMRVSKEPVCIYLFWQNPVFTSLHLKFALHVLSLNAFGF